MKLKIDSNLCRLAEDAGREPEVYGKAIVAELERKGEINHNQAEFGESLGYNLSLEGIYVDDLANLLKRNGHKALKSWMVDTLLNCILIDEFDCPYCGGKLREVDLDVTEEDIIKDGYAYKYACEYCNCVRYTTSLDEIIWEGQREPTFDGVVWIP